jgi:hypothetical protein
MCALTSYKKEKKDSPRDRALFRILISTAFAFAFFIGFLANFSLNPSLSFYEGLLYAEEVPGGDETLDVMVPKLLSSSESDLFVMAEPDQAPKSRVAIPDPAPLPPARKIPPTEKPVVTASNTDTNQAEDKATVPTFKANSKLSIPEGAKDAAFLDGCWQYGSNLMNDHRDIMHVYCFDKKGNAKHYIEELNEDNSIYDSCVNTAKARLSSGELIIDAKGPICRKHKTSYQDTYVRCAKNKTGTVDCYGRNIPGGVEFFTSFTYIGPSRG